MATQLTQEDAFAFAELLELLSFMDAESVNKIPKKLMSIFETNALQNYEKHLSPELPLEEQNISKKTISYLGVLCLNYWCKDENEKQEILTQIRQNDIKKEQELREKYSYEKMFSNQKSSEEISSQEISSTNNSDVSTNISNSSSLPMDYNSQPWFKKIFTKIRSFFTNIFKAKNPT